MLIQVNWTDGSYGYIHDFMLDNLIAVGVVSMFRRSSGWVTVGVDPTREKKAVKEPYIGSERRGLKNWDAP